MKARFSSSLFYILCFCIDWYSVTSWLLNTFSNPKLILPRIVWSEEAEKHQKYVNDIMYPNFGNDKQREHLVADHPIFNFLHNYYRFSVSDIKRYSPGLNTGLAEVKENDLLRGPLNPRLVHIINDVCVYLPWNFSATGIHGWPTFLRSLDVLSQTTLNKPNFHCFGLHEWAMLYQPEGKPQNEKHQKKLKFRVSQETINTMVESQLLSCTHYDAWRFFHEEAKPLNPINPLSRSLQPIYEQPACIHANMDLFKYAYQLHPLIPSSLLRDALQLALDARAIDIRASPYDATMYEQCKEPIPIETEGGRRLYVREQEALTRRGNIIRLELLRAYVEVRDTVVHYSKSLSAVS